jgi:hypothetical protein
MSAAVIVVFFSLRRNDGREELALALLEEG